MTCPSPDCHQDKEYIRKCVDKIKEALPLYLTKSTAKWAIGLFFTLLLAFGIAYGNLTVRVTRNTTNYEHLINTIEKMPTKGDIYRIVNKKLSAEEKRKMMEE